MCVCVWVCASVYMLCKQTSKWNKGLDVSVGDAYEILSEGFTERKRVKSIGQVKKSIKIRSC